MLSQRGGAGPGPSRPKRMLLVTSFILSGARRGLQPGLRGPFHGTVSKPPGAPGSGRPVLQGPGLLRGKLVMQGLVRSPLFGPSSQSTAEDYTSQSAPKPGSEPLEDLNSPGRRQRLQLWPPPPPRWPHWRRPASVGSIGCPCGTDVPQSPAVARGKQPCVVLHSIFNSCRGEGREAGSTGGLGAALALGRRPLQPGWHPPSRCQCRHASLTEPGPCPGPQQHPQPG